MWCHNALKGHVIILTMIRKISKSTLMSSLRNNWTMTVICGALDDCSTRFSLVSSSSTFSSLWRWTDRTSAKLFLWKHEHWSMRQSDTSSEHSHQLMWEFQVFSCSFLTLDGANKHTLSGLQQVLKLHIILSVKKTQTIPLCKRSSQNGKSVFQTLCPAADPAVCRTSFSLSNSSTAFI